MNHASPPATQEPPRWRSAYERGRTLLAEGMYERAADALRDAVSGGGDAHPEVWIALGECIVATIPSEIRGPTRLYTDRAPPSDEAPPADAEPPASPEVDAGSTALAPRAGTTALEATKKADAPPTGLKLLARNARSLTDEERDVAQRVGELESIAEMLLLLDATSRPAARLLRIVDHSKAWLRQREGGIGRARLRLALSLLTRAGLTVGGIVVVTLYGKSLLLIGGILLIILLLFALVGA